MRGVPPSAVSLRIETLERDANTLLESYAVMMPESLGALVAEERHRIYRMLRLRIQASPDKTLEAEGVLGAQAAVCGDETRYCIVL